MTPEQAGLGIGALLLILLALVKLSLYIGKLEDASDEACEAEVPDVPPQRGFWGTVLFVLFFLTWFI